jgi:hypothetical protein
MRQYPAPLYRDVLLGRKPEKFPLPSQEMPIETLAQSLQICTQLRLLCVCKHVLVVGMKAFI